MVSFQHLVNSCELKILGFAIPLRHVECSTFGTSIKGFFHSGLRTSRSWWARPTRLAFTMQNISMLKKIFVPQEYASTLWGTFVATKTSSKSSLHFHQTFRFFIPNCDPNAVFYAHSVRLSPIKIAEEIITILSLVKIFKKSAKVHLTRNTP